MRKFTILLMLLLASSAQAARIKDVAQVAGVVTTNWSDTAWSLVCRGLASRHLLLIKALTPCCKVRHSIASRHQAKNQKRCRRDRHCRSARVF